MRVQRQRWHHSCSSLMQQPQQQHVGSHSRSPIGALGSMPALTFFRVHVPSGQRASGPWHLLVGPQGPRAVMRRVLLVLLRTAEGMASGCCLSGETAGHGQTWRGE
jgi:hypothetical protein